MKLRGVYTSVIGTFPLEDSIINREKCLSDLIEAKIDFPTYPQLAGMGEQFLDDIVKEDCGIISTDSGYKLSNKEIKKTQEPPGLELFFWSIKYLDKKGLKDKIKLKAAITGPFTLASYIKTGLGTFPLNTALSSFEMVKHLTSIVSKSCEVASRDAYMISIDEPVLSVIIGGRMPFGYHEEDIIETYDELKRNCGEKVTGTHICGRISPKLAHILLKTRLDFLSHEFYDSLGNISVYNSQEVLENNKILSIGCLSSKNSRVEKIDEILSHMEKFRDYQNLIFTPDCGFRNLVVEGSKEKGHEIAMTKLRNMVEAADKFRKRYS